MIDQLPDEREAVGVMDRQVDRAGRLSPVEESAAEVSTDSGNVSQSTSSFSMLSEGLSSGSVSQSHSFNAPPPHSGQNDDLLLQRAARSFSAYIRANADDQVRRMFGLIKRVFTVK